MANILIVEDNPDLADLFSIWSKLAGHIAKTCRDGFLSLQILPVFNPVAVLLDLGLPGMNGWELAQQIRRNHSIEQPKLIAISAFSSQDDLDRSRLCGIDLHLAKPITQQSFQRMLSEFAHAGITSCPAHRQHASSSRKATSTPR